MIRKIIEINEEKCNGCGACATACHEGAIGMVNGKAKLLRDDYCDGLGDCLPACPTGAISFVMREAAAYDETAVLAAKEKKKQPLPCGCPGSAAKTMN
ncbi:MAG: 4Fe-4S binding protein, partial [Eubacterium sp.]|nr:4Fe-4S binding protein [Eubacterium sp.]